MESRQPEGRNLVKVLVVDDNPEFIADFKRLAASEDRLRECDFLYSPDGNDALKQYERDNPQVVVLDMWLPKRSGFLVIEKMKRGKKITDPPHIIMVTGNLGVRHQRYAKSLGVAEYLQKVYADDIEKAEGYSHSVRWMNKVLTSVVGAVESAGRGLLSI